MIFVLIRFRMYAYVSQFNSLNWLYFQHSPKTKAASPKNKNVRNLLTSWLKPQQSIAKDKPIASSAPPRRSDLSQDIFASSSESEVEAGNIPSGTLPINVDSLTSPSASTTSLKNARSIAIVDHTSKSQPNDSVGKAKSGEELIVDKSESTELQVKKLNISPSIEKPSGPRQRSLLDMLDQCYKTTNGPDTKRICLKKTGSLKSTTPTK